MSRMPVLFIGHGSPMNAIENNEFSKAWTDLGRALPRPSAILCVSAHWETESTAVTAAQSPRQIYDFFGFPPDLYQVQYPAPGSPPLSERIQMLVQNTPVTKDYGWGLDHGSWSVLCRMYPLADIPVVQLSMPYSRDGNLHYGIGKELASLRDEGVLIMGSGNIVHNLRRLVWEDTAFDWAVEFDTFVKEKIDRGDHHPLINFQNLGAAASQAINSGEHYLPLLYVLGASNADEPVQYFVPKIWGGSISMRCVQIG